MLLYFLHRNGEDQIGLCTPRPGPRVAVLGELAPFIGLVSQGKIQVPDVLVIRRV